MTETKSHNIRIRTDTYSPSADSNYVDVTKSMMNAAKEKANFVVESARDWLKPTTDWANISQLESLSTVMFSPLAAHPVYRSEAMVKALQLMQQQQQRPTTSLSTPSNNIIATRQDYVLQGNTYAWPSSKVLLQADIPETSSPVSLYQGFSSAYPSFTRTKSKKQKQKKKKMGAVSVSGMNSITSNGSKGMRSYIP
ncbi:hypothetical protein BDB01DRAFT_198710 [Pilobolus umbonatus]|nr:hypothetical protein BDB01DRAFT_198710 [Pilobolus umbonatus]